jgi:predicted PurR-regulated permease PerM
MKKTRQIICILILLLPLSIKAEAKEIPYAIDDRDRLIRTEQKVEAVDAKIDMKVEGLKSDITSLRSEVNVRFDHLFNFLWAIIGIFTTMMVSIFGFAFWDRKLSMAPLKRENEKTIIILRDFAKTQPKLAEILRNAGLL